MKIAFIGTGLMGFPMALNLIRANNFLCAWNRTTKKAKRLVTFGAEIAKTPVDCVSNADAVVVVLENGPVVESVIFDSGAVKQIRPGTLFIDMSSIPPETAREHGKRLSELGGRYIDAPVSGGPYGAEKATLAIMAGASPEDYEAALPILSTMGNPTLVGKIGAGQLAKQASQIIVAAALVSISEAFLLAQAGGADPDKLRKAFRGGLSDSKVLQIHGRRMVERNFLPGGHIRTHQKDLSGAILEALKHDLNLPFAKYLDDFFSHLCVQGLGDYDHSAVLLELEEHNTAYRIGKGNDKIPT